MTSEPAEANSTSRIPNFFRMPMQARITALHERGLLTDADLRLLESGEHTLKRHVADKMIENVVGVLGLPLGLGLNFLINGRDYVVPLSVEEPSIVAGLSGAARTARLSGGFDATTTDPILIGQVQLVDTADADRAAETLLAHKQDILDLANSFHLRMVARGGGARDVEVFRYHAPEDGREMVVLHLLVDTRDAMGANLVNGMCEGVAPLVESLTGGKVFLRILSNLTDRALVRASVRIPAANLATKGFEGDAVRDGIILANDLALVDPYRAATHNKGIMNGVDAVAIATGNDFRAIEAAAHAYAARDGRYRGLTRWTRNPDGDLVGELDMPMKVGTVGGSLQTNPTVRINHRLLGSPGATELAGVMGAVGLAQNYAALRALITAGIQRNHMTLHARSVASAAEVPEALFDQIVDGLIESGEIKVWKARALIEKLSRAPRAGAVADKAPASSASGKVILLGEHAVVYGRSALAAPIPLAVEARVSDAREGVHLSIPRWGLEQRMPPPDRHPDGAPGILAMLLRRLDLADRAMTIEIVPHVPRAMGLGGSASLAVAVLRALDAHYALGLADEEINAHAFECEQTTHGRASGVDNTVATYGAPLLFRNREPSAGEREGLAPRKKEPSAGEREGGPRQGLAPRKTTTPEFESVSAARPLPLVVGIGSQASLTAHTVSRVQAAWKGQPARYDAIFDQIESLTLAAVEAMRNGFLEDLGELMNLCHGHLNALQVSTPELEQMVHIARTNGAVGAKLTGGGGGGSIVALAPRARDRVSDALQAAGFETLSFDVG